MDIKALALLTISLLMINSIIIEATPPQPNTINIHHDFENIQLLGDYGYYWGPGPSSNAINVSINSDFSYSGKNSLLIEARGSDPVTFLDLPLYINFEDNQFFSVYVYIIGFAQSVIRITVEDNFGNALSLDYGLYYFGWEEWPIFDMGIGFESDDWTHLSRDLSADITLALSYYNPFYGTDEFVPVMIRDIFIFQGRPIGLIYHNFFDDLIFANNDPGAIEWDGNTDLSVFNTYYGPNGPNYSTQFIFPMGRIGISIFLGLIVIGVTTLVVFMRKRIVE